METATTSKLNITSPEVDAEQKKTAELAGMKAMLSSCIDKDVKDFQETMRLMLIAPNAKTCLQAPLFDGDSLLPHLIKINKFEHAVALMAFSDQLSVEKRVDVNVQDKDGKTPVVLCLEWLYAYTMMGTPTPSELLLTSRLLEVVDLSVSGQKAKVETILKLEQAKWAISRNSLVTPVFDKVNSMFTPPPSAVLLSDYEAVGNPTAVNDTVNVQRAGMLK